jgi:two-component system KDP operon response regulator KdpE
MMYAPIRRFLNTSLSGQYTVLEAAMGEQALAVTVTERPDVIILDLGLRDLGGVEVTRRPRERTQTPIIVVSVRVAKRTRSLRWTPELMTI